MCRFSILHRQRLPRPEIIHFGSGQYNVSIQRRVLSSLDCDPFTSWPSSYQPFRQKRKFGSVGRPLLTTKSCKVNVTTKRNASQTLQSTEEDAIEEPNAQTHGIEAKSKNTNESRNKARSEQQSPERAWNLWSTQPKNSDEGEDDHTEGDGLIQPERPTILLAPTSFRSTLFERLADTPDIVESDGLDRGASNHKRRRPLNSDTTCSDRDQQLVLGASHGQLQDTLFSLHFDYQSFNDKFLRARQTRFLPKVDLSYTNVRLRESAAEPVHTPHRKLSVFRAGEGLRSLLAYFARHFLSTLVGMEEALTQQQVENLNRSLLDVFSPVNLGLLESRGYLPEDLLSWTWILSGADAYTAVHRYVALCRHNRHLRLKQPPLFLCLQLLRLERIDGRSLRLLFNEVCGGLKEENRPFWWDQDSAAIFLIRMLRHARLADVRLFVDIAAVAPQLLSHQDKDNPVSLSREPGRIRRLTHFYNRFLTLLALPVPEAPFVSVPIQQRAQLDIARFMQESQPEIPINREGFRAFVRLQLMHDKTLEEQEWARAKGPSWPPWRRDQLGIQEKLQYPGRFSRAMKVLQRMMEAGYSPSGDEAAAAILAGWDTDKSPTIQIRKLMSARPLNWLRALVRPQPCKEPDVDQGIWAARVAATRSVREAWMCFYSYMEATSNAQRHHNVYHAMFDKLLAVNHTYEESLRRLPGDGREVHPDPISSRDRVYVPQEPPTTDELYLQMRNDGIRPAGRLLADLIDHATSLQQGLQYLQDSSLGEVKQDVLLHAEKYPSKVVRDTVNSLPQYLFVSFLNLCIRSRPGNDQRFLAPTSLSSEVAIHNKEPISPFKYGKRMLQLWRTSYLPPYNAMLSVLVKKTVALRARSMNDNASSQHSAISNWIAVCDTLEWMSVRGVTADIKTLASTISVAQAALVTAGHNSAASLNKIPRVLQVLLQRVLTMTAMQSRDWTSPLGDHQFDLPPIDSTPKHLLPSCKEMEMMFFTFALLNDKHRFLTLLQWMHKCYGQFWFDQYGKYRQRQMMAAIRATVEHAWIGGDLSLMKATDVFNEQELQDAVKYCEHGGWASDEEVETFLASRQEWLPNARRSFLSRAS